MPDETTTFDAAAAAQSLAEQVGQVKDHLLAKLPTPDPRPLFSRKPDGSVMDRNGQQLRGAIEPLPERKKQA